MNVEHMFMVCVLFGFLIFAKSKVYMIIVEAIAIESDQKVMSTWVMPTAFMLLKDKPETATYDESSTSYSFDVDFTRE